jgi:hypothetical protein
MSTTHTVRIVAAVALAASVATFTTSTDPAPVARHAVNVSQVPPCLEEDSAGPCFWDASTRGNGVGVSFTVDGSQVVHYAGATR